MFDLINIINNTYYIKSSTNIGVFKINDKEIILIDSGTDKDCGKKIKKLMDKNGLSVKYIYNTHSHADHIGANNYLQDIYNCEIFNMPIENYFVNNPELEAALLYGAHPLKELNHKFLSASKSFSHEFTKDNLVKNIKLLNLPGHSLNMCGFLTSDNVAFLGDALVSEDIIKKYSITYLYDVALSLDTLEYLKTLKADYYIISHGEITDNISNLVDINLMQIQKIIKDIINLTKEEITFESLLSKMFALYNIRFTYLQNVLIGSTLKAYLSYLIEQNKLIYILKDNSIYYKSI